MTEIPSHMLPTKLERGFDGYALAHRVLRTEPGLPPEFVVNPDFWVHVADRLKAFDQVLVIALDGTFEADLRVMAVHPGRVEMRLLREWPLGIVSAAAERGIPEPVVAGPDDPDGYTVEWGGPAHRFRIVNRFGVVAKDFPSKDAARAALAEIKAGKTAEAA